jgi:hypothetical protein
MRTAWIEQMGESAPRRPAGPAGGALVGQPLLGGGLRGSTSIGDRARHNNSYIENWSMWLDIKIILRTFAEVIFHRGR